MPPALMVFWACVAACVVAHGAIFLSVLRRQGARDAGDELPRGSAMSELLWAVLPLVALSLVLLASYPRVRERAVGGTHPVAPVAPSFVGHAR